MTAIGTSIGERLVDARSTACAEPQTRCRLALCASIDQPDDGQAASCVFLQPAANRVKGRVHAV